MRKQSSRDVYRLEPNHKLLVAPFCETAVIKRVVGGGNVSTYLLLCFLFSEIVRFVVVLLTWAMMTVCTGTSVVENSTCKLTFSPIIYIPFHRCPVHG